MNNKFKILSIFLVGFGFFTNAQDLGEANKAIDAEQFQKAKSILKSLITSKPDAGKNYFVLGNLYLTQKNTDSAAINFNKGIASKTDANFNYIGLGQIDLDNNNLTGATANFDKAKANIKKKNYEEYIAIARAFMNSANPNFKSALENLNKAKLVQPENAQVLLALGDAYYGDGNTNEAFSAYRNAYDADNSVLRAKLKLAVITKNARAFAEAKSALEGMIAANPNYGPAFRELAETYYLSGINDKAKFAENSKMAIQQYEKYMSLTDYSLDSRMRHADFLVLTKDFKALEAEANAMQKLDKVNPRILRYLGYAAYENGNPDAAIKALDEFLVKSNAKIIGRDYLFLGLAKTRKALVSTKKPDGTFNNVVDGVLFNAGIVDIKKGVELDPTMANELNDFGKLFFDQKLYKEAAALYEVAVSNPNSRNFLFDNFYLGYALYYDNAKEGANPDLVAVKKAITAFGNVIKASPSTQDAYIYSARLNGLLENDEAAQAELVKNYQDYINVVTQKGADEVAKTSNKTKFAEAYNNIALYYLKTDKVKAKEYLNKVLAIEPTNENALANLKLLK